MKKFIPLLLFIMSMSLFSQESKYWEKIDFQFDSGIKIIDIYQYTGWYNHTDTTYIVISQNNKLYYFDKLKLSGTLINGLDTNIVIEKAKLIRTKDSTYIFILTNDNKLMMTNDFGQSWKVFETEIDNSKIIDIAYSGDFVYSIICLVTTEGTAYLSQDFGNTWEKNINGIKQGLKIKNLTSDTETIYALTDELSVYKIHYSLKLSWEKSVEINNESSMSDFRVGDGNLFYFDESKKLKIREYNDLINKVEIPDSINITCYTVSGWMWLVFGFQLELLPVDYQLVIGTEKFGMFFYKNEYYENLTQPSKELYGKIITDIETNSLLNPTICILGTKEGELYYGGFGPPPNYVENSSGNKLNTQISPLPVSTKARLRFTLPADSRISVKLYNALGIEMMSIAKGIFNQGENSISIDAKGLSNGIYFIAIQYDGNRIVEKMVVNR